MSALVPITSIGDLRILAEDVAKSRLFGVQTTEEAMALMLIAQAEGLHPAVAIQEFDIIQGKPARKTTALLARFQEMGGKVTWKVHTDAKVVGLFEYKGTSLEVEWTMERATKTQYWDTKEKAMRPLSSKFNWKSYPRQMLRARVIAEGIRAVCPRAIGGLMVVEEAQDAIDPPIDVIPVEKPAAPQQEVWTEELKLAALAASDSGKAAYSAWWKKQSEEFRSAAITTNEHAEFKAAAEKASASKRAAAAEQPAPQEAA